MGLNASPTTALYFDAVTVGDDRQIGDEGQGAPDCPVRVGFWPADLHRMCDRAGSGRA